MRLLLLLPMLLCWSCQPRQTSGDVALPAPFDPASLREGLAVDSVSTPFEGALILSMGWSDQTGSNLLLFSGKTAYPIGEDLQKTELYARAYTTRNDTTTLQWQLQEVLDSCYCDCSIEIDEETILDIDGDGTAEACFLFFRNDRCDVSPMPTKLVIASAKGTFFLEGFTQLFLAPDDPAFQKISASENFGQAPEAIQDYALRYWNAYLQREDASFEVFKNESPSGED